MSENRPATPQLDKMVAVREESRTIGEFLTWLQAEGYVICVWRDAVRVGDHLAQPAGYYPAGRTAEQLLAAYFGIDLEEAERERQAVLEWVRRQQEAAAS